MGDLRAELPLGGRLGLLGGRGAVGELEGLKLPVLNLLLEAALVRGELLELGLELVDPQVVLALAHPLRLGPAGQDVGRVYTYKTSFTAVILTHPRLPQDNAMRLTVLPSGKWEDDCHDGYMIFGCMIGPLTVRD